MIDSRFRRCSHWPAKLVTRLRERGSASIRRTCASTHPGPAQFAALGDIEQLVVGDAAPEEERQAGRELDVGDAVGRARRDAGRVRLDAKEELRIDQYRAEGHLDPGVEAPALLAGGPVQLHRLPEVVARDRPPVGPARQAGDDAAGTRLLIARPARLADEDPAAAGRVAVPLGGHTDR